MPRALPPHPDLEQYKKQAKDLLKAARSGESDAQHRLDAVRNRRGHYLLADAQLALTREHGFQSWPEFAREIESLSGPSPRTTWRAAANAVTAGDEYALAELLTDHADLLRKHNPPAYVPSGPGPYYGEMDTRTIIAREHHFGSWDEFEAHRRARADAQSRTARFENAADAISSRAMGRHAHALAPGGSVPHSCALRTAKSIIRNSLHYVGAK
jgi:hypothetical protein